MKKYFLFFALFASACICTTALAGQKKNIAVGDTFPAVKTDHDFTDEELSYFGIQRGMLSLFSKKSIAIADIDADIILVEFFNNYCTSCQAQAPIMNEVYQAVQKNQALAGKVRFIGIGAGNNAREVSQFKQRYEVPFPMIPDRNFSLYDSLGEPGGTPYVLILKKRGDAAVVVEIHKGLTNKSSFFIDSLTEAAEQDISTLTSRITQQDIPQDNTRKLKLHLTNKQLHAAVKASMEAACPACGPVAAIRKITTVSENTLYTTSVDLKGKPLILYSKLFSQQPVCDVCHGIHYIITFDAKGFIRDFKPLHITKYGNVDWNDYDIENMRKNLIGKRLNKELLFRPTLDAISTATMSSALVYKGANELRSLYKELK